MNLNIFHFGLIDRNYDKPKLVEAFNAAFIRDVSAGSSHSAAITSDGELYTWGLGEYGRLGHGDTNNVNKPKLVRLICLLVVLLNVLQSELSGVLKCIDHYATNVSK